MLDTDKPYQAQDAKPADMPETMVINGVTYRRESGELERTLNFVRKFEVISRHYRISMAQAVWFHAVANDLPYPGPMPD